ncbi:MAG: acyltransferase [Sphingobacteriaceae bacterium]|nr:MAG: acyltransferase [Sphingobacteriaceae bacterium]
MYLQKLARFKRMLKYCGEGTFIQFPVRFEGPSHISIGKDGSVNAFVHMWGHGQIIIGDNCLIASHVSINSVSHDTDAALYRESVTENKVTIGNNVWIGTHAVILPGVTIGDNAIIGACALVNKNVPANAIVAGIPAKIIRYKK